MGTINSKLVKIAAGLSMALLIALSFLGNADKIGQEYTDTAFQRALITFASARAINGLISVAQGTEVAIQPGGIGTVLTPGEILDPINDLVEQFSQVMLFSTVVLGTQKILIEVSGWFWFSALMALVLFFWLASLWLHRYIAPRTQRVALGFLGILLIVRFLVPIAAIANEVIFDVFLAPGYEEANRQLEDATTDLDSEERIVVPVGESADTDKSLWEALGDYYELVKTKADVGAKLDELKTAANNTAEVIIDLIVVFIIQTLLLPLIFAWIGYSSAKYMLRYALGTAQINKSDSNH
jgi:hypothetical protein